MAISGSYFYPGGNSTRLLTSYQDLRLVEVNSAPDAIGDTASVFLSESGGTQGLYWVNDSGTVSAVGSGGGGGASDIELNVGSKLVFDADADGNNYISSGVETTLSIFSEGSNVVNFQGGLSVFPQTLRINDNVNLSLGTGQDYRHTYNSAGSYEFWHTNVDGSNTDGIVWSVEDGTDDVSFNGGINLNRTERLVFDADEDSDTFIDEGATNLMRFSVGNANAFYINMDGPNLRDNKLLQFGTNFDYWQAYNPAGAFELWSTNVDGGGTNGKVFWVEDGTDDVNFSGGLNLNIGEKLVFDADGTANDYIRVNSDNLMSFYVAGANPATLGSNYLRIADNGNIFLGTSNLYYFTYRTTSSAFEFRDAANNPIWWVEDGTDDVNLSGSLKLNVGEKLMFDADASADNYITGVSDSSVNIYVNSANIIAFTQTSIQLAKPALFYQDSEVQDNVDFALGNDKDYWHTYNSTAGSYEFWSTSGGGGTTDGKVWWVEDGTDDVNLSGSLKLNVGEKLMFDADADANNYIYASSEALVQVVTEGIVTTTWQSDRLRLNSNISLALGTGSNQFITYNSATTDVTWNDGTNDVITIPDDSNEVRLTVGGKLVFDGDAGSDDYMLAGTNGRIDTWVGGNRVWLVYSTGAALADDKSLFFGTGRDQSLTYTDGTGVTWANPIGDVFTISDTDQDVSFGAAITATGAISGAALYVGSGNNIYWNSRAVMKSPGDGQWSLNNFAQSQGATLDVTTADTLTIKDQAGTGAGHLATSGQLYSILSTTETPTGTTETIDWNNGNSQVLDLGSATGDVTLTLSNGQAGASYVVKVVQDATTPRDIVWPGSVLWPDGTTPVISTGASAVDVVSLFFDGTSYYANIGQNYA